MANSFSEPSLWATVRAATTSLDLVSSDEENDAVEDVRDVSKPVQLPQAGKDAGTDIDEADGSGGSGLDTLSEMESVPDRSVSSSPPPLAPTELASKPAASAWLGRRLQDKPLGWPPCGSSSAPAAAAASPLTIQSNEWVYPALVHGTTPRGSSAFSVSLDGQAAAEADEEADGDNPADANRFVTFRRSTVVAGGRDHPDPLCEPQSVRETKPEALGPEDDVRIPRRVVDEGKISSTQLECVALASRRFRQTLAGGFRAGFLLGDGTGCGKGRCISALIMDQWNRGARRHVWVSATADLYQDAIRDLKDLGANIPCASLTKVKAYGAIDSLLTNQEVGKLGRDCDGILFVTYAIMVGGRSRAAEAQLDPSQSRFGQIIAWLKHRAPNGDGAICFDEAHKAKNLDSGSKVARLVDELQSTCPGCCVLYASATGATEVNHMQYMSRLGLWGRDRAPGEVEMEEAKDGEFQPPFDNFRTFSKLVRSGGMPAMELVAMQLKSMGALSCRSLAFDGTTFDLATVKLTVEMQTQYDASCRLWRDILRIIDVFVEQGKASKWARGEFWSAQQRFFKGLVVAAKVPECERLAKEALVRGESVVISLWTTNESVTNRAIYGDGSDGVVDGFASGPELTIEQFLDKNFPEAKDEWAQQNYDDFKTRLKNLQLPPNPIDDLIDRLGGPEAVAEMSGRSHRQVRDPISGEVRQMPRKQAGGGRGRRPAADNGDSVDSINNQENRAFQTGKKVVAIITEAASAGISLHCDRREVERGVKARPRRMMCLELPWAADKAVQQMGRVHRSNQSHPPAFTCVVSDLGGEARFVSAVMRRIRQLGAMTRGDRQAAIGSNDSFGFGRLDLMSGPYGHKGLGCVFRDVLHRQTTVPEPQIGWPHGRGWRGFADEVRKELEEQGVSVEENTSEKKNSLKKFLNRLLGVSCAGQAGLFWALSSHIARLEEADREAGTFDEGVVSLNKHTRFGKLRQVHEISTEVISEKTGGAMSLKRLKLDRGLDFESAQKLLAAAKEDDYRVQGFYMRPLDNAPSEPVLVLRRRAQLDSARYVLHYPHVPMSSLFEGITADARRLRESRLIRCETAEDLEEAEQSWRGQYARSEKKCFHLQRNQRCQDPECIKGRRCFEETLLTGQILAQWEFLDGALGGLNRAPLVRSTLADGRVLVGLLLPPGSEERLKEALQLQQQQKEEVEKQRAADVEARSTSAGEKRSSSLSESDNDVGVSELRVGAPLWARGAGLHQDPPWKRPRVADPNAMVVSSGEEDEVSAVGSRPAPPVVIPDTTPATRKVQAINAVNALRDPQWMNASKNAPQKLTGMLARTPTPGRPGGPGSAPAMTPVDKQGRLEALRARIQERIAAKQQASAASAADPAASSTDPAPDEAPTRPLDKVEEPPKYRNEVWSSRFRDRNRPKPANINTSELYI